MKRDITGKGSKSLILLALIFLSVLTLPGASRVCAQTGGPGSAYEIASLPAFDLPAPKSEAERTYLGLTGTGSFGLGQIKAQVVIIEMFSTFCPHCQKLAPSLNKVYQEIEERPDLKGRVKIIGIGMGDRPFETKLFKEKFHIPFPLFSDPGNVIAKRLSVSGTPTLIATKANEKGEQERFYFHPGPFEDPAEFLKDIVKRSGLK